MVFLESLKEASSEAEVGGMTLQDALCMMLVAGIRDTRLKEILSELEEPTLPAFSSLIDAHLHAIYKILTCILILKAMEDYRKYDQSSALLEIKIISRWSLNTSDGVSKMLMCKQSSAVLEIKMISRRSLNESDGVSKMLMCKQFKQIGLNKDGNKIISTAKQQIAKFK